MDCKHTLEQIKVTTYTEEQGHEPFDWFKFLNRTDITLQEWVNAKSLASSWITCACGNQCSVIPRFYDGLSTGEPQDPELRRLGYRFTSYIGDCTVRVNMGIEPKYKQHAILVLHEIEERSAQLIKEINENI